MTEHDLGLSDEAISEYLVHVRLRYDQESRRPDTLNSRAMTIVTACTIVWAATVAVASRIGAFSSGQSVVVSSLMCIAVLSGVGAVSCLCAFFWGKPYGYPPDEIEIRGDLLDYATYFDTYYGDGLSSIAGKAELLLRAQRLYLADKLTECINQNLKSNHSKSNLLLWTSRALVVTLTTCALALVVHDFLR